MMIRNLAPESWLIAPLEGGPVVYFHNTTSFGVCPLTGSSFDGRSLIAAADRLGLSCQLLPPRRR